MIVLRTFARTHHEGRVRFTRITTGCRGRRRGAHGGESVVGLVDGLSASQILGLDPVLVEQMAEDQQIPHYKIGEHIRFDPHDLHVWVERRRVEEVDLEVDVEEGS
jgi:excisionase family DNA binding protein